MYVLRSLSPRPDKQTTTMSSGLKALFPKMENAWAVSIAGIFPSNCDNYNPAVMASSYVTGINSALLVMYK